MKFTRKLKIFVPLGFTFTLLFAANFGAWAINTPKGADKKAGDGTAGAKDTVSDADEHDDTGIDFEAKIKKQADGAGHHAGHAGTVEEDDPFKDFEDDGFDEEDHKSPEPKVPTPAELVAQIAETLKTLRTAGTVTVVCPPADQAVAALTPLSAAQGVAIAALGFTSGTTLPLELIRKSTQPKEIADIAEKIIVHSKNAKTAAIYSIKVAEKMMLEAVRQAHESKQSKIRVPLQAINKMELFVKTIMTAKTPRQFGYIVKQMILATAEIVEATQKS